MDCLTASVDMLATRLSGEGVSDAGREELNKLVETCQEDGEEERMSESLLRRVDELCDALPQVEQFIDEWQAAGDDGRDAGVQARVDELKSKIEGLGRIGAGTRSGVANLSSKLSEVA